MQNRADLLKKLELTIQQEIINYNNSLSSINLRINSLSDRIEDVEKESLENDAAISSELKNLEIRGQYSNQAHHEANKRALGKFTNIEQRFEKLKLDVEICLANAVDANNKTEFNENGITAVSHRVEKIEDELIGFTTHIHQKVETLSFQLKKEVNKAKEEILSIPSEAKIVKQELEEKLNSHAVDVEGLLKEIRASNKAMMILEKKIENLYTLVDRLQKGGEK